MCLKNTPPGLCTGPYLPGRFSNRCTKSAGRLLYPAGQDPRSTVKDRSEEMKRARLLTTTSSSRPGHLVCPACESGELQLREHGLAASCAVCDCLFSGAVLKVLARIAALV